MTRPKSDTNRAPRPAGFTRGAHSKLARRIGKASKIIVLDEETAEFFPYAASVNSVLRKLARISTTPSAGGRKP